MLSYDSPMPANQGQKDTPELASPPPTSTQPSNTNGTTNGTTNGSAGPKLHHIWLVTGPAGCGKTTVADFLSSQLNLPYIEGDSYHPAANIEKMSRGIPLADADRWDWLTALRDESVRRISSGSNGVVLTCSALKRKYRDVIRVAAYFDHSVRVHFIFLDASASVLLERVKHRKNHYMGANMVQSQFDILERPTEDESDVITINVGRTQDEVKADVLAKVLVTLNEDQDQD